jgi:hypothetical protein
MNEEALSMKARRWWQAATATAIISLALLGMAAIGTGAQAAGTLRKCANTTVEIEISSGTVPPTYTKYKMPVKAISVSGVSCAAAYKFIGLVFKNHTTTTPEHFKCAIKTFKVPPGYVPTVCTHGATEIRYAGQGG